MLKFKIKIFISYSDKDKTLVSKLKQRLSDFPLVDVFVAPEDIPPGVNGDNYIREEVKNSDYFIAYMTDNYHKGNWTEQEVGLAWAFNVPIIPFIDKDVEVHGYSAKFQIKEIPDFYNFVISKILLKLYGKFVKPDDLIVHLIEKELPSSTSYARSNAIGSLIENITPKLSLEQSTNVLRAFLYYDQVTYSNYWTTQIKLARQGKKSLIQYDPHGKHATELDKFFEE